MKEIPTKKIALEGEPAEKFKAFVEKDLERKRKWHEEIRERYNNGEFDEIFKKI